MATAAKPAVRWSDLHVPIIYGLGDKRIETGEAFVTRPLGSFWTLPPSAKPKHQGLAFVPSLYSEYDAREHAAQREHGQFVALVGDIDKGNLPVERIDALLQSAAPNCAYLIHSTANAIADDMRWRMILPLDEPVDFPTWRDAQEALFDLAAAAGLEMDGVTERAGQISFLPNVPMVHDKTGQPLRDKQGPLYYSAKASDLAAPGLDITRGALAEAIAALRLRRAEDERLRDQMRAEAERRRASQVPSSEGSVIDAFNRSTNIADLLSSYGYAQSRRNPADWRSPLQTSGSFATRIMGGKWVSLSGSDAAAGIGARCASGCFGDAFDLFVHWEHGGNRNAAWKQVCQEQRRDRESTTTSGSSSAQAQTGDPGPSPDDYGDWNWDEADDPGGQAGVAATPYTWIEPEMIPMRPWVFGRWLLRGTVAAVIAPGGVGKTTLLCGSALSMITGRQLLGKTVWDGPKRVWIWNLEDPVMELQRSIQASALHWGITREDVEGRLFVDTAMEGRGLCTAVEDQNGFKLLAPIFEAITAELVRRGIDVLVVDPFVSSHEVEENANSKIDKIAKAWGRVANVANCTIVLVHHTSKAGAADVTALSARGAKALTDACRSALVLNRMDNDEADRHGFDDKERRRYFTVQDDKHNRAPAENADWFRLESVDLGNGGLCDGDSIGVAVPWRAPDPFEGLTTNHLYLAQCAIEKEDCRANHQSPHWVGFAVARALGVDADTPKDKKRLKSLVSTWLANGALKVVTKNDKKGMEKEFVEVGKWANDFSSAPPKGEVRKGAEVRKSTIRTTTPSFSGGCGEGELDRSAEVRKPVSTTSNDDDGLQPESGDTESARAEALR